MNTSLHVLRTERGFTLMELMVSMTIGLILLAGVAQVFTTSKRAYNFNESTSEVQDNGSFATEYLGASIVNAGYIPNPSTLIPIGQEDTSWAAFEARVYPAANPPITGTEGGGTASDTLVLNIAYPNAIAIPPTDCRGQSVLAPGTFTRGTNFGVTNTFSIATGASGRPGLFCNGVEIVSGVDNMQLLYGVDTDADRIVDRYLRIDQVGAANLSNILTVRVALLLTTTKEQTSAINDKTYDLLGTNVTAPGDKRQRQVYTSTIRLRNRCALVRVDGTSMCM